MFLSGLWYHPEGSASSGSVGHSGGPEACLRTCQCCSLSLPTSSLCPCRTGLGVQPLLPPLCSWSRKGKPTSRRRSLTKLSPKVLMTRLVNVNTRSPSIYADLGAYNERGNIPYNINGNRVKASAYMDPKNILLTDRMRRSLLCVPLSVMDCLGSGWFYGFEEEKPTGSVRSTGARRGVDSTTNGLGHQVASLAGLEVQLSP